MAKKFYAVVRGKEGSAVYDNWATTESMVKGIRGVKHKSFDSHAKAMDFLKEHGVLEAKDENLAQNTISGTSVEIESKGAPKVGVPAKKRSMTALTSAKGRTKTPLKETGSGKPSNLPQGLVAYVDGSFRQGYEVYGYGVVLLKDGQEVRRLSGYGHEKAYVSMRNVAGEVFGAMAAMDEAVAMGEKTLTIFYDYQGIESWATGAWKRNNDLTRGYHDHTMALRKQITLCFVKVKGHSGDYYNDLVDELAKEAVRKGAKELG